MSDLPHLGTTKTLQKLLGDDVTVAAARRVAIAAGEKGRKRLRIRRIFQLIEEYPEILDGQSPECIATGPRAVNGSTRYA